MKSTLTEEIRQSMTDFFKTATDDEFWATLEEAGWSVFSEVDVPILNYHSKASRYLVTAKQMSSSPILIEGATICYTRSASMAAGLSVPSGLMCTGLLVLDDHDVAMSCAANNNELALAA